jgi:putative transposase
LTDTAAMRSRFPEIAGMLRDDAMPPDGLVVRDDETIGRPRGDERFVLNLERKTGRTLRPGKRGRRRRQESN